MSAHVTHHCPGEDEGLTLCCRRPPFELPRDDWITLKIALVTCEGVSFTSAGEQK